MDHGAGPDAVAVGDFNEDGRPDVLAANSGRAATTRVSVLLNTTPVAARAVLPGDVADFGEQGSTRSAASRP